MSAYASGYAYACVLREMEAPGILPQVLEKSPRQLCVMSFTETLQARRRAKVMLVRGRAHMGLRLRQAGRVEEEAKISFSIWAGWSRARRQ